MVSCICCIIPLGVTYVSKFACFICCTSMTFVKGLCLFRGVVHVVHLGVVMLQLLYIWYIITFVCKDKIRTSCVLYMLSVGHLDIMCVVHVSHVWCYYSYMLELYVDP
jgi:hypothetical protein